MVPDTVTHGTGGKTGGVKGMVVGSLRKVAEHANVCWP
jgi:hypothetical protein